MSGIRSFYRNALSPFLALLGIFCALGFVSAVRQILTDPSILAFSWAGLMATAAYFAFTNAYRARTGMGRLPIDEQVEHVLGRLKQIPRWILAIPVIGPLVFASIFLIAATMVFFFTNRLLWEILRGGAGSIDAASFLAVANNFYLWPILDASTKLTAIAMATGRVLLASLLVNALFAKPPRQGLEWGAARTVLTTYGAVILIALGWLALGITKASPPLIFGTAPYLLVPALCYWQVR